MSTTPLAEAHAVTRRAMLLTGAGAGIMAAASASPLAAQVIRGALGPNERVTPFEVAIDPRAIKDLRARLVATRWSTAETVGDWSQGVPLAKAKTLIDYWAHTYDMGRVQRRLNAYPQFRTEIDGLGIHFLHVRSKHPDALPIIFTHGWPGSVFEFLELNNPLVDPTAHGGRAEDAFHVVIPSQPGFGFSDKPADRWNAARTAKAWGVLMTRLGYDRWVAQGGDWGATVTGALGQLKPSGLAAIHLNWQFVFPETMPTQLSPDEKRAADQAAHFHSDEGGYYLEQMTRPQNVGYALADSPVGQATWIYEIFNAFTDSRETPLDGLSFDQLLDNISLYWFTDTAASSARIYWDNNGGSLSQGVIETLVAVTIFPKEIYQAPKSWAERDYPNLFYWNEVARGDTSPHSSSRRSSLAKCGAPSRPFAKAESRPGAG